MVQNERVQWKGGLIRPCVDVLFSAIHLKLSVNDPAS